MRRLVSSTVVLLSMSSLLSACELIPLDLTGGTGNCDGDVTVSEGLTPTFTWEGGALGLGVAHYPDGADRTWVLSSATGTTPFNGPVTYGTVPAGALEAEGEAVALEAGVEYSVTITLEGGAAAVCALFTP